MEEQAKQKDSKRLLVLFNTKNRTEEQEAELNELRQEALQEQLKDYDQVSDQ